MWQHSALITEDNSATYGHQDRASPSGAATRKLQNFRNENVGVVGLHYHFTNWGIIPIHPLLVLRRSSPHSYFRQQDNQLSPALYMDENNAYKWTY
jgi:hypothetical protein